MDKSNNIDSSTIQLSQLPSVPSYQEVKKAYEDN